MLTIVEKEDGEEATLHAPTRWNTFPFLNLEHQHLDVESDKFSLFSPSISCYLLLGITFYRHVTLIRKTGNKVEHEKLRSFFFQIIHLPMTFSIKKWCPCSSLSYCYFNFSALLTFAYFLLMYQYSYFQLHNTWIYVYHFFRASCEVSYNYYWRWITICSNFSVFYTTRSWNLLKGRPTL